MNFSIDDKVFDLFPDYTVAVVIGKNINNFEKNTKVDEYLDRSINFIINKLKNVNMLNENENIRIWRTAFEKLNVNPKNFMSSIEAMALRIVKSGSFPKINPIVDLANGVALKYLVPIGAHDLEKITGDIKIRFSKVDDVFTPMGSTKIEPVTEAEIVYADEKEIRTRKWIWRQGDCAKITQDSRHIFFPIDGFANVTDIDVLDAQNELNSLLKEIFNINTQKYFLDKNNKKIKIL